MKRTLLLLIACIGFQSTIFATTSGLPADSLRRLIENTPKKDSTYLELLSHLSVVLQSTPEGLQVAQQLYREADLLHSDKYKCYSAYYHTIYYFNHGMVQDSINHYTEIVLRLAEKEQLWSIYFKTQKRHINMHIFNQEFEYSIEEAIKMRNKAKEGNQPNGILSADICLATAYIATERVDQGIEILQQAYHDITDESNAIITMDLLSLLISTSKHKQQYDDVFRYLEKLKYTLKQHLNEVIFSEAYNSVYIFMDIYYAYCYSAIGQPKLALKHLQNVEKHKDSDIFINYKDIYFDAYADYYVAQKQYDKAIAAIDSSIIRLNSIMPKDYYKQLTKKANILSKTEQVNEALILYQEIFQGKDSVDRALSNKQMVQIQDMYNLNKLLLENEQIKHTQQTIILIILIVIIILLAIFALRTLSVRRKLMADENQMRQATKIAEDANEIKNLFLSNMSYNIRTPLNNVVGFSQLMAIDPEMDDKQRNEYSIIIKKNTEILLNLVNDVLDLSRLEAGMMKFNIQEYEVVTLCREAIYASRYKSKQICVDFQPELEEQIITTDTFRFTQLIESLLTYPIPEEEELTVLMTIKLDEANENLCIKTIGSPISTPKFITQEVSMRNEINSLFLKHFGGTYNIDSKAPEGPTIVLTYPVNISK